MSMRGAIVLSVLVHALAFVAVFEVSRERQAALVPAVEQAEQPPIEVEILADPRAGAPDTDNLSAAEQTPAPPPDSPADTPSAQAEAPAEAAEPTADPPPMREAAANPMPPSPTEASAQPTARPAVDPRPQRPPEPPPRPRAGSGTLGREDGTTDIVLGANTVPAGLDPSQMNIPPRYPREASQRGQQGVVRLSVVVATDGTALSVDVAQSSGYPLLDRAARDAVAKWRFRPGQDGGLTVPSTIPVTLSFVLSEQR